MSPHTSTWSALGFSTLLFALTLLMGCSNELERFCEKSTTDVCHMCYECAPDDDSASALCGLLTTTNEEGCRVVLHRVCASDDVPYNGESAKSCQKRIEKLSCDQLKKEGKPEVCGRLF